MLSIVVPFYNEEGNVESLYKKIKVVIQNYASYEMIFVDDGSADQTPVILEAIAKSDPCVKVIQFAKNYGQTAAMMAGIEAASHDIIVSLDGDNQNDPADIPMLLSYLNEGYDVVSGWRVHRKDNRFLRTLPSKIANKIISKVSGVSLHDYGCSLKAYKRDIIKHVRLYGEMHRFIPIYASWFGGKVKEVPVNHYPRTEGTSKYGINRIFKVVLDLIVVKFLQKYINKPIYIMGMFGLICLGFSFLSLLVALYWKFFDHTPLIVTPLPMLSTTLFVLGIMSILLGLLAEVMSRTYYESQDKKPYHIKKIIN